MNNFLFPLFLSALAGSIASFLVYPFMSASHLELSSQGHHSQQRALAGEEFRPQIKNQPEILAASYSRLPCPTESEFIIWSAELKLSPLEGPSVDLQCDEQPRAKLAKIFKLMRDLKFSLPQRWPSQLQADITNTFEYLKNNTTKLALDLNQRNSIAYNKVADKEIFLGGIFFTQDPLDGIGTLFHEARHSSSDDPGHTICSAGNIPKTKGGCDQKFSTGSDAGAYSYNTLFELAVAFFARDISEVDREQMLAKALVNIGARFNQIPSMLARKVDFLIVLSEKNEIHLVHPFLFYAHKLSGLVFETPDELPVRLEFSPAENGVFIFTNKKRLWVWSPLKGLTRFKKELISLDEKVYDISRTRIPGVDDPKFVLRLENQKLVYIDRDPQDSKEKMYDFKFIGRPMQNGNPLIHRLFMASGDETVFLAEDGKMYLAPHYGNDPIFVHDPLFDQGTPWVNGTGGVTYDDMYLLNREGKLYSASYAYDETIEEGLVKIFTLQPSQFAPEISLKKYSQGLRVEMGLNFDHQIQVKKYGEDQLKKLQFPFQVIDFVLAQNSDFGSFVTGTSPSQGLFRKKCQIVREIPDPWLQAGMGYNASGQLIIGTLDEKNPCQVYSKDSLEGLIPYFDTP